MRLDVSHVAKLANLELSPEEKEKFQKQLSSILSYVEKLNEVDTKDVLETSQVTGLENVTREDKVEPSLSQEEALSNVKPASPNASQDGSKQNGYFKTKAILDNE